MSAPLPLTSRLSYHWSRVAGQSRIYSPVFKEEIDNKPTSYFWYEARPFGKQGVFLLDACSYTNAGVFNFNSVGRTTVRLKDNGRELLSKEEVRAAIKKFEERCEREGRKLLRDQPFSACMWTSQVKALPATSRKKSGKHGLR